MNKPLTSFLWFIVGLLIGIITTWLLRDKIAMNAMKWMQDKMIDSFAENFEKIKVELERSNSKDAKTILVRVCNTEFEDILNQAENEFKLNDEQKEELKRVVTEFIQKTVDSIPVSKINEFFSKEGKSISWDKVKEELRNMMKNALTQDNS